MFLLRVSTTSPRALFLQSAGVSGLILALACGGGGSGSTTSPTQANRAPVFGSIAPTVSKEGHAYTYVVTVSDADGDSVLLKMVASPSGATFEASTRTISWMPTAAQVSSPQSFDVLADDGKGGIAHQTWSLTPTADAPPVFTSTAAQAGTTGTVYSYTPTTTDADGDSASYRLINHPSWAGISGGVISGTPPAGGYFDFTLQADDGHGKTTDQSWTVTVVPSGNRPPVITSVPSATATGGVTYLYTIQAADPDADTVTYRLVEAPAGASLVGNVLSWTPSSAQERIASTFTLQAVDAWGAASDPQTWGVSPSGTIRGTRLLDYAPLDWSTGKVTLDAVPDPGNPVINVLVPVAGGGFSTLPGNYTAADGTFSVGQVPAGHYWLKINKSYIWTDKAQVDLGNFRGGRKDATPATIIPTNVSFTLAGMTPWNQSGDYLQFYDWNSRSYVSLAQDVTTSTTQIASGATSINGLTDDWAQSQNRPNLVDMAKGDHPLILHMATQTAGAQSYQVAKDIFEPVSLSMADGLTSLVSGTFSTPLPSSTTVTFNWAQSAFAQYQNTMSPNASYQLGYAILVGYPDLAATGLNGVTLDLAQCLVFSSSQDVNLGPISLPNLPGHLDLVMVGASYFDRPYQIPGASYGTPGPGYIWSQSTSLPSSNRAFQPLVSPAQNPVINGQSLYGDLNNVGLTPTLSWVPPASGTPTGYEVDLYRLSLSGNITQRSPLAYFYTSATSLQLPPGILQAGDRYCFTIRTYASPGWDPALAPFRMFDGTAFGFADTLSGIFTP